jgi:hypothetical protein
MTRQPHLKDRVRARMERTGERYAVARDHVLAGGPDRPTAAAPTPTEDGPTILGIRHLGGAHPETTAFRIVAAHAGIRATDGRPPSEPLCLVVGGGIGIGVFAFHYEKEAVSTFFVGGRHRWDGARGFLELAARRLGLEPTVVESGGARQAVAQLEAATADGPAIAWVDLAELGTRGYPADWSGGGYHVLVVYGREPSTGDWLVGDLARDPIAVAPELLSRARARIVKQRNRVMTVAPAGAGTAEVTPTAVLAGLRATVDGLRNPRSRNFGLDALADLADRLDGRGRDAWSRTFPRGGRLFAGLASIHRFVETYGSGGGLLRPLFAAGLVEAATAVGDPRLAALGERYAALGAAWSDLAHAALPDEVPLLREARELDSANDRHYRDRGPAALDEIRAAHRRLAEIEAEVARDFPLDEGATADLLAGLASRVRSIHAGETAALEELGAIVADAG